MHVLLSTLIPILYQFLENEDYQTELAGLKVGSNSDVGIPLGQR